MGGTGIHASEHRARARALEIKILAGGGNEDREARVDLVAAVGADRLLADEAAFAALNAVFVDSADFWREDGVPFWVFYDLRADGLATLPTVA